MSEQRREERHVVQIAGRYRLRHRTTRDIWIKDVSEYGCRFFDRFSVLEPGSEVLVRIGNIGPIETQIRWRRGNSVGGRFEQPLHPGVLDHILREMDRLDKGHGG